MSALRDFLLDMLYPPHCCCFLCDAEAVLGEDGLCDACRAALRTCSMLRYSAPLDGLAAGLRYDELVHGAIHRLKYQQGTHLVPFFVRYMHVPADWVFDCIIPVPLHPIKYYLRGYNQSLYLAEELCRAGLCQPVRKNLLRRKRYTVSQTQLGAARRRKNLLDAFCADPGVRGLSVLLVDDVATTRSTLYACVDALKKAGAVRVYAICACDAERI